MSSLFILFYVFVYWNNEGNWERGMMQGKRGEFIEPVKS